jgi:uncharacterized protein YjbI with pentapeptide repeats
MRLHRTTKDIDVQRSRVIATTIVGSLVAVGVAVALGTSSDSVWRELSIAIVSGGVVGGALLLVETLMGAAADERERDRTLRNQLSSTSDLNGIDISGEELSGVYLPGRAFVAAKLDATNLNNSKLYWGDFRHASFVGARLQQADLSGSTLAFADLSGADLSKAILFDVDMTEARLHDADLEGVVIDGGRLKGTSLRGARLVGAQISNTYLEGARFDSAHLADCTFTNVSFDLTTTWPPGFTPPKNETVIQPEFSKMDFKDYLVRLRQIGS